MMTTERVILLNLVLAFIGKVVADFMRERARSAHAERERVQARDRTHRENEAWLRTKVDEMVEHERETYRRTLEAYGAELVELRAQLAAARDQLEAIPELVEDFLRMLTRIDPARTPTVAETDHLRSLGARVGLSPSLVNGLVISKAGA